MNVTRTQALRALPIADLMDYLVGEWDLTREIVDHGRHRLHLEGGADVRRRADGSLAYFEHATLATDAAPIEFTRAYLLRPTSHTTAHVELSDGSPFYDLDLSNGRCRAQHLCGHDLYIGLVLTTRDGWITRWRCRGPEKDYVATTLLSPTRTPRPAESIA